MAEITIMDMLLLVLTALFLAIAFFMRRLRNRMEADMKKNIGPYMGLRHVVRHSPHHESKRKKG